ncbi:hypothetical protein EJ903_17210 [Azospirillum griseum]|uniref:Uncharacterized protein n=1 Tax=Azospirillum griseum TaxID=2496639 RepID=A0A431VEP4_9PROT|nr:hypothetical protein EJ903_17210 [Azospirillum griseum]
MTAFSATLRATFGALLLAGPAVAGLGSLAFPLLPAAAVAASPFVPGLADVPAMPGLEPVDAEPLVFDKPDGRIVQVVLSGMVPRGAVLAFYDQTLPQLGWSRAAEQRFVREGEGLRLDFVTGSGSSDRTTLRFTLTPR